MYTPFLYHSNYGFGGSSFKNLFEHLNKYNIRSCGIVDETFFGLPEFIKCAKIYNVKPIIGARILINLSPTYRKTEQCKIYLFVRNQHGYENICQILTEKAFKNITPEFIKNHSKGLILLSNSINSLKELSSAFAEKYYLLLPYHTLAKKEFPPLAAHEIFYVTKQEKTLYKLMCAIKKHHYEHKRGIPDHLLTCKEFDKIFVDYPEAVMNNHKLAQTYDFVPKNRGWIFPESKNGLYEIIKPKMKSLTPVEKTRIEYEYKIIKETGFEPHFSLVHHLKEFALSKGIGMNVRGSAASSFILYLLGLSIAHPLKYNLPFERFLNPQRTEPPDIDIDVEFNQRDKLIREIFKKFGNEYVAHVSVINRFKHRARFRDTARAYGISPQELKNIKQNFGERLIRNIYAVGERIHGFPHYFSCHASGIIMTPEPIYTFVPLYPSPAGQITHFDKDGIEIVGLVKIDILGVRGFPHLFLSKEKINYRDKNVYEFICKGGTLGCFQIESPMVRQFIKKINPKTLMDIANAIAVIRPGPAQGGMKKKFLKRLKGEEKIKYPHPHLEKALRNTMGIPIYQEQILQIAHDFARFSLSDADMLRRAMTKTHPSLTKQNPFHMDKLKELFFNKAYKIGYSTTEIEPVWDRIVAFSSFGFNKAHSITYATLAYLSAYQKFYSPLDFFCRVINNKGGYYPTYAYINEARRWGIKILPPNVERSENNFAIFNSSLITGLNEIRNLSSLTIERIIKHRPFYKAERFFYYVRPSIDESISLINSGALDMFGYTWPELYFMSLVSKTHKNSIPDLHEKLPQLNDFSQNIKLKNQLSTIGFLPGYHILEIFYPERTTRINDLAEGDKKTIIGIPIARRTILTKNRKLMSFVTIDDESGTLEVIIFPDKYRSNTKGLVMEIQGTIQDNSLIADNYTHLQTPKNCMSYKK